MHKKFLYILILSSFVFLSDYDIGDSVSELDQNERFTICNGEHFNNDFKLSHLNGNINGGHYFVSWFDISATW